MSDGVLYLSKEQARALAAVFYKVGGHPARSPRGHIASIADQLFEACPELGCRFDSTGFRKEHDLSTGRIRFDDYANPSDYPNPEEA